MPWIKARTEFYPHPQWADMVRIVCKDYIKAAKKDNQDRKVQAVGA
jgi:hypothetical protein